MAFSVAGSDGARVRPGWGPVDVLSDLSVRPEIVGICDVHSKVFAWYVENYPELRVATTDHRELLEQDEIEAVYCAVPHNLHAELYIDVIESGRHLLGEKPFGIDLEANARIMTAIREHPDVFVRVSSGFPFYPGAQRVARHSMKVASGRSWRCVVAFVTLIINSPYAKTATATSSPEAIE